MKMKPRVWDNMRDKKKEKLKSFGAFDKLNNFSKIDRGGLDI
jgi:cytochrome c556